MVNDLKRSQFHFWKTVATGGSVFIALATYGWIVWQVSSSHHRAEIESLRQTLATVSDAYDDAARKMEGLLEPQLLTEDTLRAEPHRVFRVLGGRRGYRIIFAGFYYHHWELGVDFFCRPLTDAETVSLTLRPGERHEFEFEQRRYYAVFYPIDGADSLILARLYELEPLYRPAAR
jgi:hypothetical protein